MPKRNKPLLPCTPNNVALVSQSIKRNETPDLLQRQHIEINKRRNGFGFCHTDAGASYIIFGSQNLRLMRAKDNQGIYHWWVADNDNNIIDLTAQQYSASELKRLYANGEKSGLLGFRYRPRVMTMVQRVCQDLGLKVA